MAGWGAHPGNETPWLCTLPNAVKSVVKSVPKGSTRYGWGRTTNCSDCSHGAPRRTFGSDACAGFTVTWSPVAHWSPRFRVSGCGVSVFGFRISGSGFQVPCFGFRVSDFGFRVSGSGFRISGSGFRVPGSEFRVFGVYTLRQLPRCSGLRKMRYLFPLVGTPD